MKILNVKQIRELDSYTISEEGIASYDLMERACRAFTIWFTEKFHALHKVTVVCGAGNNGGDGLGIARMLKDWGYPVTVYCVSGSTESTDFKKNLERITATKINVTSIDSPPPQILFADTDIIVDALFGSGLTRPIEGIAKQVIDAMNTTECIRVAVDLPSGLLADAASSGAVVRADYTVSFQLPKLAFLFPSNFQFVGEWVLVDIGLSKKYIKETQTPWHYLTTKGVKKLLRPRSKFDHKGTYGHALIVAGSMGKVGACVLSAKAALRAGAGLVSIHAPRCAYNILQTVVPEAMVSIDAQDDFITNVPEPAHYTTLGIGPGLGQKTETVKMLRQLLEAFQSPVVLDADALNIIAAHRELLHLVPSGSIITPHPKEFERLVGEWKNDFERLEKQKSLAAQINGVVVLKGAYTSIAGANGNVHFNSTGNPGMATGGTGDVLTGILTSLLAQGYPAVEVAILGVYLHGLAGDLAAIEKGYASLIAGDLIDFLPAAFRQLNY